MASTSEEVEHQFVEGSKYEEQIKRLVDLAVDVIGEDEWQRRLDEEYGGGAWVRSIQLLACMAGRKRLKR